MEEVPEPPTGRRYLVAGLALAVTALFLLRFATYCYEFSRPSLGIVSRGYLGPLYFVSSTDGFVRRGLPGTALHLVGEPTPRSIDIAGWSLTLGAALAVLLLAVAVYRQLRARRLTCSYLPSSPCRPSRSHCFEPMWAATTRSA